ncbi:Polysaccharide biosynthesis protein [uncultured archaeon]|nr:Polysaccharide biosynthesis protein [uncultured archaeon]
MIFEGKTILVTGGTGSMGKTFVRRVLTGELGTPKKIIVFSRDEAKQHDMRMSYLHKLVATDEVIYRNFMNALEFRIGDVRDYSSVCSALKNVDIVVNAAAMKQVPTCEYFPTEAVLTNCIGATNIVRAIEENNYPVDTVISISTDKACKPVNVMGMTKSIQERIITSANILNPNTRFICVRYGNVLASRGSVIPLFHEQIKNGGPVTVTIPEMTRFLLSLNQAVDTVFIALREAKRGETYVPIAPAATILNIAKALIGKRRIEIKVTGIRPGEKMHEIMVSEEEANHCVKRGEYYAIRPMLPELCDTEQEPNALTKEFSSADTVLDLEGTIALLRKHRLMIEDVDLSQGGELLR